MTTTAAEYRRRRVVLEVWENGLLAMKAEDPAPTWGEPQEPCACLTAMRRCSTISITKTGAYPYHFDYNIGYGWQPYRFGRVLKMANAGDRVWLRAHEPFLLACKDVDHIYVRVTMTGRWSLAGNIDALFARRGTTTLNHLSPHSGPGADSRSNRSFYLFKDCQALSGEVTMAITHGELKGLFNNTYITRFSAPNLVEAYFSDTFLVCQKIASISMPALQYADFGDSCFAYCYALRELVLPALKGTASRHDNGNWGWETFVQNRSLRRLVAPLFNITGTFGSGTAALDARAAEYVRMGTITSATLVAIPTTDSRTGDNLPTRTLVLHAASTITTPTGWTRLTDTPAISTSGNVNDFVRTITITTDLTQANVESLGLTHTTAAAIYYTLDGTTPSATHGTLYTAPFELGKTATVKAVAINTEGEEHLTCRSDVKSLTVEVRNTLRLAALTSGASFQLVEEGTMTDAPEIEYSTDGGTTWTALPYNTSVALANAGDAVYLRCPASRATANVFWESSANRAHFTMSGAIEASGSVMSLADGTSATNGTLPGLTEPYQLAGLFYGCGASLKTIPELTATTPTEGCYYQMFKGCEDMEGVADLKLTSLTTACCTEMFRGCESLRDIRIQEITELIQGALTDWVVDVAYWGDFHAEGLEKTVPQWISQGSTSSTAIAQRLITLGIIPEGQWSIYGAYGMVMIYGDHTEELEDDDEFG